MKTLPLLLFVKESNKVEFISIDAAINQGYNGCYDCRWYYDTDHLSWNR